MPEQQPVTDHECVPRHRIGIGVSPRDRRPDQVVGGCHVQRPIAQVQVGPAAHVADQVPAVRQGYQFGQFPAGGLVAGQDARPPAGEVRREPRQRVPDPVLADRQHHPGGVHRTSYRRPAQVVRRDTQFLRSRGNCHHGRECMAG